MDVQCISNKFVIILQSLLIWWSVEDIDSLELLKRKWIFQLTAELGLMKEFFAYNSTMAENFIIQLLADKFLDWPMAKENSFSLENVNIFLYQLFIGASKKVYFWNYNTIRRPKIEDFSEVLKLNWQVILNIMILLKVLWRGTKKKT